MVVCAYEDRANCETGVRLLIASLCKHSPRAPVVLHFPPANAEFKRWLAQFPNVELRTHISAERLGWNIKPLVLLAALDEGHREAIWIDTDIILTKPVEELFCALDHETFAVAEESLWGTHDDSGAKRARAWGLPIGREMPFALNSCVLRATDRHRGLIERWRDLLSHKDYRAAQKIMPVHHRPVHLTGDQDVLCALLCSTEFSNVPVRILRRGEAVLQIFGLKSYTIAERLQSMRYGVPAFIHAQGFKPWTDEHDGPGIREYLHRAYYDTSPYIWIARTYRDQIGDAGWLQSKTALGGLLRFLGFGCLPLAGLPLAFVFNLGYGTVSLVKESMKASANLARRTRCRLATY
ncbi:MULTISPECIES: hypothetical protein [unclassified Bradyrhizobium]